MRSTRTTRYSLYQQATTTGATTMKIIREDTLAKDLPSTEIYAAVLHGVVAAAIYNEAPRFDGVTCFNDLHDRCDANEFYQLVDDALHLQVDEYPESYFDMANEATSMVERMFGWVTPQDEALNALRFAWNECTTMLTTIHSALCESLGEHFTCVEAAAIHDAYMASGMPIEAAEWMIAHAAGDEEGDEHYEGGK